MFWRREIGQLILEILQSIPAYKDGNTSQPSSDPKIQLANFLRLLRERLSTKQDFGLSFGQTSAQESDAEIKSIVKNASRFIQDKAVFLRSRNRGNRVDDEAPQSEVEWIDQISLENEAHLEECYKTFNN